MTLSHLHAGVAHYDAVHDILTLYAGWCGAVKVHMELPAGQTFSNTVGNGHWGIVNTSAGDVIERDNFTGAMDPHQQVRIA